MLAVGASVACFVIGWWMFPISSPIVDERVYLQQSQTLSEGHLVLPEEFRDDRRPFFTAPNAEGELVFKYPPLWPAVLVGADLLTGTSRAAVAFVAFFGVLGVGLLAWELTARRSVSMLAAIAVVGAPLFILLSASRLSYGFGFVLAAWSAFAMLRAARTGRWSTALVAGLLSGTFVALRPYDAALVLGVFALWVWWAERPAQPLRLVGLLSLGAVAPLGLLMWSNWATTGDPLQLPFTLVGPNDRLGFGPRLDVLRGEPFDFTLGKGLEALRDAVMAVPRWGPFGVMGLALLVWGLWRTPRRLRVLLAAWIAIIPLGYVFFWGSWNGFVRLDVLAYFGPFYYLPIVIPIALAGAVALADVSRRVSSSVIALGMVAALAGIWGPIGLLRESRDGLSNRLAAIDQAASGAPRSLVVVEGPDLLVREPSFNSVGLDSPMTYAVDLPGEQVQLLERFEDRRAIRERINYVLEGRPGTPTSTDVLGFARQRMFESITLLRGSALHFEVSMPAPVEPGSRLVVRTDQREWTWLESDGSSLVRWDGSPPVVDAETLPSPPLVPDVDPGLLCLGRLGPGRDLSAPYDEVCFDWAQRSGDVVIVTPGRGATRFAVGEPVMLDADISDRIVVTPRRGEGAVTGGP
jgi:hypothetical protein